MIDREEVLKGLVHHRHLEVSRNELSHDECFDCPYRPDGEDTCASLDRMIDDALELLKEQPEIVRCKDCKHATMTADGKLCKYCDLAENDDGSLHEVYYNANWYCPCGEVKQND